MLLLFYTVEAVLEQMLAKVKFNSGAGIAVLVRLLSAPLPQPTGDDI